MREDITTKINESRNHLGVEVDSSAEVAAASARLQGEGMATAVEDEVTCCYAVQDKVWVDGPSGEPWEIYTVLADAEMPAGQLRTVDPEAASACCGHTDGLPGSAATCC